MRILVTGAAGSVGQALLPHLQGDVLATDKHDLDITDPDQCEVIIGAFGPELVYHLAAQKFAPEGEDDPERTLAVNATGTANVVRAANRVGAKVITASTCKACDPETVYGASKLIAERLTLNAGGWVARFYNVRESCGNVLSIWASLPEGEPLPVAPCHRYFITSEQVTDLLLKVPTLPPGRYTVNPGDPVAVGDLAAELYPGRETLPIEPRRGDRVKEPRTAASELLLPMSDGLERIYSVHDVGVSRAVLVAA